MACSCKNAADKYEVLNSEGEVVDHKRTEIEALAASRRINGSFRIKAA